MQDFKRAVLVPICTKDGLGLGEVIDLLEQQVEDARVEERRLRKNRFLGRGQIALEMNQKRYTH
jgi:hypothetical protein